MMWIKTLLLTCTLGGSMFAADITGKWSGKFEFTTPDGQSRVQPAFVIVKQEDSRYSATGGPGEAQQRPLGKVAYQDGVLHFELGERPVTQVELKLSGDELTGQGTSSIDGKPMVAKWSLKRVP